MTLFKKLGNKTMLIIACIVGALMIGVGANNDILMLICGIALIVVTILYCLFDDNCEEEDE